MTDEEKEVLINYHWNRIQHFISDMFEETNKVNHKPNKGVIFTSMNKINREMEIIRNYENRS